MSFRFCVLVLACGLGCGLSLVAAEGGEVQELTEENFSSVTASGMWFVEFFAPWCGHCQKLAPIWDELAEKLHSGGSSIEVAKLDCTAAKPLCQGLGVRGFPTLMYINEDVKITFRGNRNLEEFVSFLAKVQKPGVSLTLTTSEEFSAAKAAHSPLFFLALPDVVDSNPTRKAFEGAAQRMLLEGTFAITSTTAAGLAEGIHVYKNNEFTKFEGEATADAVAGWVKKEKLPSFFEMTREAGGDLTENPEVTLLAVLVVDAAADNSHAKHVFEKLSLTKKAGWNFVFTWMGAASGVWQPFVERQWHLYAADMPAALVFNLRNQEYFLLPTGTAITEESVSAFLDDVASGRVTARGGQGLMTNLYNYFSWGVHFITMSFYHAYVEYPAVVQAAAASVLLFIIVIVRNVMRSPAAPKGGKKD